MSIGVQPFDGNYARLASRGVVFSKRMRCPSRKPKDDYQYFNNIPYPALKALGWKMNCTGMAYAPFLMGTWGFLSDTATFKTGEFKQLAQYCFIYEYEIPCARATRDANYYPVTPDQWCWPQANPIYQETVDQMAAAAVHSSRNNLAMLDGHISSVDNVFIRTSASATNYPFCVP